MPLTHLYPNVIDKIQILSNVIDKIQLFNAAGNGDKKSKAAMNQLVITKQPLDPPPPPLSQVFRSTDPTPASNSPFFSPSNAVSMGKAGDH